MTAPAPAAPDVPGYRVGERLGAGGFGEVFAAHHAVIGRRVAIKILHAKYSADSEAVARFIAEARAVNTISHPNIVEIVDFAVLPDGRHYCVMELIEGVTLRQLLRERERLPLTEALPILRGIADAVDAAHAKGIAHRDLKPDNVFVRPDGSIKLIDFGLAKLTAEEVAVTETGAVFGTPLYMSPEQCRGKAVSTRTDAYSFGVLAFQMLTGEPPFKGDALEIALQHLNEPPPAPSSRVRELPPAVDRVILDLLAKDPAQRPIPIAGAVERMTRPVVDVPTRKRYAVPIAVACAVGAIAIAATSWPTGTERPDAPDARRALRAEIDASLATAGTTVLEPRRGDAGDSLEVLGAMPEGPELAGKARELVAMSDQIDDLVAAGDVFARATLVEDLEAERARLVVLDPRKVHPAHALVDAWVQRAAGNTDAAIAATARGLELARDASPSTARMMLHVVRAQLLPFQGRRTEAYAELDAAARDAAALGRDDVDLVCMRAIMLADAGKPGEAFGLLHARLALDPDAYLAWHSLALLRFQLAGTTAREALPQFKDAEAAAAREVLPLLDRAEVAARRRGSTGDVSSIDYDRMRVLESVGDPAARDAFVRLRDRGDAQPSGLSVDRGLAFYALNPFGDLATAERAQKRVLAVEVRARNRVAQATINYDLARTYADKGQLDEAIRLRLTITADPQGLDRNTLAMMRWGVVILYLETNDPARVIEAVGEAELDSRGIGLHEEMQAYKIRALVGLGRIDEARRQAAIMPRSGTGSEVTARLMLAIAVGDRPAIDAYAKRIEGWLATERMPRNRYRLAIPLGLAERALGRGDQRLRDIQVEATARSYGLAAELARRALANELVL